MKGKLLLTVLLASSVVVAATSCGEKEPVDPNVITKAEGNGTGWIEGVQGMFDKVMTAANYTIAIPYVDAEFYSAEFSSKSEEAGDVVETQVICENSTSMDQNAIKGHMETYTAHFEENGFEIDKSLYNQYRVYSASKKIKGAEYLTIQYGFTVVGTENEYDNIYGYIVYVGYQKVISTNGWLGDYLEGWPSADIADAFGNDVPHPAFVDEGREGITYFGGFNLMRIENEDGSAGLLECYVIWLIGSTEQDLADYLTYLESLYWEVGTFTNSSDKYAFNFLSQVVMETLYMSQEGYGSGMMLFMYLNVPEAVFKKSAAWPEVLSTVPAYVEGDKTFTYYLSTEATEYGDFYTLVVGGVGADAETVYTDILTAAGWSVEDHVDNEGFKSKYATKGMAELSFYVETEALPDVGTGALIIQVLL